MNDEKLEKIKKLKNQLDIKKSELKAWRAVTELGTLRGRVNGQFTELAISPINLNVLKTLTVDTLAIEVNQLQEEYDNY